MSTKWDLRFLGLAEYVSTWSKDPSTTVGAAIADPLHRIISVGYNGPPHGLSDDEWLAEDRERKLAVTLHAETNAILFAGEKDLAGCTIYTFPLPPCAHCASQIRQVGIARVVAPLTYDTELLERWRDSFELAKRIYGNKVVLQLVDLAGQ